MSRKTAVLVLAANPKDTPSLRLDQEVREIQDGLLRSGSRSFRIRQDWAVRPRDVRRALLEHRPRIVHFCGHGSGEEGLVLEDDRGQSQVVSTNAIAGLFALVSQEVRCVVLNACFSEKQAKEMARHVEYVIGMNRAIDDSAAIEFSVGFYDAIAAGESYELAYRFGCNAIELASLHGHLTPVLLTREGSLPAPAAVHATASHASGQTRSYNSDLVVKTLQDLYDSGWSTMDVMKRVEEIDYENIAGLDPLSEGSALQWSIVAESNPDGYAFVVDGRGQIVGYWHFEALPEDLLGRALRGELEDEEITIDNVTLLCAPGIVNLYVIIFVVEKGFRGLRANRLLLEALLDRLEQLARIGIFVDKVCANAFTPEGVGLCRSLGMNYLHQHKRSGLIFELELRKCAVLLRSRPQLHQLLRESTE